MQILFIIVGVLIVWLIVVFNQFVSLRNKARNAFSNIDVMLKKRIELIPQLVQSVQGYMKYEQVILEKITLLRAQLQNTNLSQDKRVSLNNDLTENIGKVIMAVENYPNLKASGQFLHLQKSITEIEEQLSASRRSYNMSVTLFNTLLQKFPSKIVGSLFGFKKKIFFNATVSEKVIQDISHMIDSKDTSHENA